MAASVEDMLGTLGGASAPSTTPTGMAAQAGVDAATGPREDEDPAELELVKKFFDEYKAAREFDKDARIQYNRDRKYAAGLADPNWASDANLIGSFIDILVSFLYAQNPDPGVKPALQVDEQPNDTATKFATTMELVISRLWKDGHLKLNGKKWVRSALTCGPGWLKGTMLTQKVPAPELEQKLNTAQDQLKSIQAAQAEVHNEDTQESTEAKAAELQVMIRSMQASLLKKKRYGFIVDYVRPEDIQVSLNVADLANYKEADWISTDIYVPSSTAKERFEDLTDDELKAITKYYQKNVKPMDDAAEAQLGDSQIQDGTFSTTAPSMPSGQGTPTEFIKIIERWDRRDFMVKTAVEGLTRWAKVPYPPPQASTRFYPFFYLAFFPVEGKRHPQSLSWRLRKLQDEYSSCRSNQRLSRERSVTGVIFNEAAIDPQDARKITDANQQELIGVRTAADQPLSNVFIAKPVGTYNPMLYDTQPIRADMESISGVQEALQQNAAAGGGGQPKTATEAQIEQQGFASRTGADRDTLEEALTDMSQYTAEVSTQECPLSWVQRVCGQGAFWLGPNDTTGAPPMDVEDVLTMVEVTIDAGSTGKPNFAADKANWATILPLLEQSLGKIRAAQLADPGMAEALINILKETLHRMDDRLDIDDFIPQGTPTPPPVEPPKLSVTIALKGTITPEQEQALMGVEAAHYMPHPPLPGGPGGPGAPPPPMPPGATGVPHPAAAGLQIPSHIPGTGVPMPPLSLDKPTPPKPGGPPSK